MRDRLPLILSTTALLVAVLGATPLGEAAYNAVVPKNSIGAQELRNGAVTNAKLRGDAVTSGKVKNGSLRVIDFKPGQIPAGPKGDKGDKGDKGAKGETGAPGLSGYEIVTNVAPPSAAQIFEGTATCPAGKMAVGGGSLPFAFQPALGPFVIRGYPTGAGSGWRTLATRTQASTVSIVVTYYAVCATVAP